MVIWLIASILGGILYRLGGQYQTKIRDLGIPTVAITAMCLAHGFRWVYIPCYGLLFGSLTTYWKRKGVDAEWYNWLFTGLGYSMAMLPYSIISHGYLGFTERVVTLTAFTIIWSESIGLDWLEESGRGFAIIATLPLL